MSALPIKLNLTRAKLGLSIFSKAKYTHPSGSLIAYKRKSFNKRKTISFV